MKGILLGNQKNISLFPTLQLEYLTFCTPLEVSMNVT